MPYSAARAAIGLLFSGEDSGQDADRTHAPLLSARWSVITVVRSTMAAGHEELRLRGVRSSRYSPGGWVGADVLYRDQRHGSDDALIGVIPLNATAHATFVQGSQGWKMTRAQPIR